MEPTDSFYPPCRNAAIGRHLLQQQQQQQQQQQHLHQIQQRNRWQNVDAEQSLDNLNAANPIDTEFGMGFYDPYVSEPSLDLSPYLEDIDLADTSQQDEIFDLVSSVVAKQEPKCGLRRQQQQQQVAAFPASVTDGDFERFLDESNGFMPGYGEACNLYASQTVPALMNELDWRSSCSDSGSSSSPSPELLPSDGRKLKSRRQRGRRSSAGKFSGKANMAVDKNTYEYRLKRERNNVAVRKSRMKTKEKQVAIFRKASELSEENEDLHSVVANLTEELQRLKSYLAKSGISTMGLPSTIEA